LRTKKKIRFISSKGFLMLIALLVLILILTFFFGDGGIIEIIQAQRRIEFLEDKINKLKHEKEKLEKEITELKNNPLALEKKAREKLWLMKKNEKVVVIVKDKKDKNNPSSEK